MKNALEKARNGFLALLVVMSFAVLPAFAQESAQPVNLNSAGIEELSTLKGIGPVTAKKILDFRSENGPFQSIEQLKDVSGIGDSKFEKLKDQVTV